MNVDFLDEAHQSSIVTNISLSLSSLQAGFSQS